MSNPGQTTADPIAEFTFLDDVEQTNADNTGSMITNMDEVPGPSYPDFEDVGYNTRES
jgi:hypothetical protein